MGKHPPIALLNRNGAGTWKDAALDKKLFSSFVQVLSADSSKEIQLSADGFSNIPEEH